ncbi:MAG: DM13 domain-containing protein [SAR202 cluster bacterium]|nr:DM13 domain-containing protein [SAR202 cluster bacterium]
MAFARRSWKSPRGRLLRGAAVAVGAPLLVLAWWLGSPLFLDKTVDEEFHIVASGAPAAGEPQPANDAMVGATPVLAGVFRDADSFHKGSGTATVYRLADGSHLLRLEDFDVTNGPDLFVYLSGHADPMSSSEVTNLGFFNLGDLKGNLGNQNYPIRDDLSVADYRSIVIYCRQFSIVFAVAPLHPSGA